MIPTGGTITREIEVAQQPSRTWRLDLERGRVAGMCDGLEAVQQAVLKILRTERFQYLIYDSDYGSELAGLLGKDQALVQSELRRRIREALLQDDRISDVTDFEIDISGDNATIRFTVVSAFGNLGEEVTVHV